jgi:hypothetical protein
MKCETRGKGPARGDPYLRYLTTQKFQDVFCKCKSYDIFDNKLRCGDPGWEFSFSLCNQRRSYLIDGSYVSD